MRVSKLLSPITDPVHRFFERRLGLSVLCIKTAGTSLSIVLVFLLGLLMYYKVWRWTLLVWCLLCFAFAIRKVLRYWSPFMLQKLSNAWKFQVNWATNSRYELDRSDKRPIICTNCRHEKLWNQIYPGPGSIPGEPICTKCEISSKPAMVYITLPHTEPDTGTDIFLPPGAAEVFRAKADHRQASKYSDYDDPGD